MQSQKQTHSNHMQQKQF